MSEIIMMNDAMLELPPPAHPRTHIRWMIRRDMPEVLEAENASFCEPWGEEDFLSCLRNRNTIGMIVEKGERVVGFFLYELHQHHFTILSLATHPDFRRQGIGAQMIAKLQSKLSPGRRTKLIALVPESRGIAKSFFEKHEIEIRMTDKKGVVTYRPKFSAMRLEDVAEVQEIENACMESHRRMPRARDTVSWLEMC